MYVYCEEDIHDLEKADKTLEIVNKELKKTITLLYIINF